MPPTWGSFSPPSARSSGTIQIASPSPSFQGRGSREGGAVTVTSRYTKTQRTNANKQCICVSNRLFTNHTVNSLSGGASRRIALEEEEEEEEEDERSGRRKSRKRRKRQWRRSF